MSGKIHSLSGILTDKHRHVFGASVEDITVSVPKDSVFLNILPPTDEPAATIEYETVTGSGGMTNERSLDEEGNSTPGQSTSSKLFKPGYYQDADKWNESDLLKLRKLGSLGEAGLTGMTDKELSWMEMRAKAHKKRVMNRMVWLNAQAIFTGQFVYENKTVSLGIPSANGFSTASDWTQSGSDPFKDMLALIDTNPLLIKYKPLIKGFVINPVTEATIVQRALEAGYITNNNIRSAGVNVVREFAAPGLPPFITVPDAWEQQSLNTDNSLAIGTAQYFVPNYQMMILLDFANSDALYSQYGELALTENMNDPSSTLEKKATGVYSFIDEEGLKKRKSPYVEMVTGFNGGPMLKRAKDVLLVSVKPSTSQLVGV